MSDKNNRKKSRKVKDSEEEKDKDRNLEESGADHQLESGSEQTDGKSDVEKEPAQVVQQPVKKNKFRKVSSTLPRTSKKVSTSPAPKKSKSTAEVEKKKRNKYVIIIVSVVVYLALMIIAGGVWYAYYNGSFSVIPPTQNLEPSSNPAMTAQCPIKYGNCPSFNDCQPSGNCRPQPAPTCIQQECAGPQDCPAGQCREVQCPITTAPVLKPIEPPIGVFYDVKPPRVQKTVLEWLNTFSPYSRGRLLVVTALLDETLEKWTLAGFAHRCTEDRVNPLNTTKCHFCKDRYEYIKCVMSNNLIGNLHPLDTRYPRYAVYDDASAKVLRYELPKFLWDSNWQGNDMNAKLRAHFEKFERVIAPFNVRTDVTGRDCQICKDFNRRVYNRCFSHGSGYRGD